MKYLMLCLILITAMLTRTPTSAWQSLPTDASASFVGTSSSVTTRIEIGLDETPGDARISLRVNRDERTCDRAGVCHDRPLISGLAFQDAGPNDAGTNRIRSRAFVHATIRFHDDISNATIPVRIDALWTGAGAQVCDPRVTAGLYNTIECVRTARATATVVIGTTLLVNNQTVINGELVWQLNGS